ncbi:hypothetical protein LTR17_018665 [Elasticomyces elasticus]|nr:hypothetical protein LTR17_018665 [Elasticomyces elasticus]
MVSFLDGDNADDFLQVSGMCPQGLRTQDEPFAAGPDYGTFDGATSPFPAAAPSPFAPFAPSAPFPTLDVGFGNLDNFDINDFDLSDGMLFEGEVEDNAEQDDNRAIVPIGERWEDDGGEQVEELDDADCTAGPRYTNRPAASQLRSTGYHAVPRGLTAMDANTLQYQGFGRTQHPAVGLFGTPANIAPTTDYFLPAQTGWNGSVDLDPLSFDAQPSGGWTFGSLPIPSSQPPPAQSWRNDSYDWNRYIPDAQPSSSNPSGSLSFPTNQPQQPNSSQTTRTPYPAPQSSHNGSMQGFGHVPTPAQIGFGNNPTPAQSGYGINEPLRHRGMNVHVRQQEPFQNNYIGYEDLPHQQVVNASGLPPPAFSAHQQGHTMQQPQYARHNASRSDRGSGNAALPMPRSVRCGQDGYGGMPRRSAQPTSSSESHDFGSSSSLSSNMAGAGMWRDHLGNTGVSGHHGQDEPFPPPRLRRRAPRSPQLDAARIEDLTTILDDFRHDPNTASGPADSATESLGPSSRLRRQRRPTSTQGAVRPTSSSSSGTNLTRRRITQRDTGHATDDRKKPTKVTKASLRTPGEEKKQTKAASKGSKKGKSSNRIIGHNPELERGQAAQADVALPETRATGVELLCFFPNHTQWPGVLRRLTDAGWRDEEIAAARLYFRGAVQEDRVERHWRQIRKQQKWAKDVESVEDYGLSPFAPRKTQRYKEPQHELLAEIGRNVVEWPEQAQQSFLTLAIIYAIAHPEMGYTTDDVEWLAASLGWVLPCDFTNDRLDEEGHDGAMKAMEDDGFW